MKDENINTIIFGCPCGGSSFTFELIKDFLIKYSEGRNFTSLHEPEMKFMRMDWEKFKSITDARNNIELHKENFKNCVDKYTLIKNNYFARFLDDKDFENIVSNNKLIFVIRLPWQWANSAVNSRFSNHYFYWKTVENVNLNIDNEKHIIDLWLDITNDILNFTSRIKNDVLFLDYYEYVENKQFLEQTLNSFYNTKEYIELKNYVNVQVVHTNRRRSRHETRYDVKDEYKTYRLGEINDVLEKFGFQTMDMT